MLFPQVTLITLTRRDDFFACSGPWRVGASVVPYKILSRKNMTEARDGEFFLNSYLLG